MGGIMSAFFVSAETIADAVACLQEAGVVAPDMDAVDLGKALWITNAAALAARYGDAYEQFQADIDAYDAPPASLNPWQRYKSLCCLVYQCSEGDVPEFEIYRTMAEADAILTARLGYFEGRKEYETAKWGR
jgi:hypothetical protein